MSDPMPNPEPGDATGQAATVPDPAGLLDADGASAAGGGITAEASSSDGPADGGDAADVEPASDGDLFDADEDEVHEIAPVESPYDRPGRWYVVHS